jgi:hypothetical protein
VFSCFIPAYLKRDLLASGGPFRYNVIYFKGGSFDFQITYSIYEEIKNACAIDSGLILADWSDGHYITYYSNCSVTANNMILSPVDFAHIKENKRLLGLTARELLAQKRYPIKYVFVSRNDNIFVKTTTKQLQDANQGLRYELLFPTSLPEEYQLIYTLVNQKNESIAKLYKLSYK